MQHLQYIDIYEDGIIQRRISMGSGGSRINRIERDKIRRKVYEELRIAAMRNPEKTYWMELKTNN